MGRDVCGNWQGICRPLSNDDTNERGLRLLEFATFNDLVLAILFVVTKHPEDGSGIAQMDKTTAGLITIYRGSASGGERTLSEHEVFHDLQPSPEKNQQSKIHETQV